MNFREKTSEDQLQALYELINQEKKDARAVRKCQAIILVENKAPDLTIKMMTGYNRNVAVKLRKKFLKSGIEALKSKQKKTKELLTRSQREALAVILNTQKPSDFGYEGQEFWTAGILGDLLEEQWGVRYKSKTSLYLIFKQAKFTFRKPEAQSERRNEKVIAEWKEKYTPIFEAEYKKEDSVVLVGDEASLCSETRLQRVWLPLNGPAIVQNTAKRKTVHLYGFLQIGSGVAHAFKTPSQTGEITISVLKKLALRYPNKRIVIFWDNASWHKSAAVRQFLDTTKQFQLYNFPPYAPELNPQEHVWKEVRAKKLNNRLIKDIEVAAKDAVSFIENSIFKYDFLSLHGIY